MILKFKNIEYLVSRILNYDDIDYYVFEENNKRYFYQENNELKELLDTNILDKLAILVG